MNLFKDDQNNILSIVKEDTKILVKAFAELCEPK